MAEDLTDYLMEYGFRVRYLHSEVDTLERIQIIRELRLGEFDVLVGVNLLREGLDLPEVSLVAILDADKEGFLRGETSLIQTIGRAARNVRGKVIMYADKETQAMRTAISETDRRRDDPARLQRGARHHAATRSSEGHLRHHATSWRSSRRCPSARAGAPPARGRGAMSAEEISKTIVELEEEMLLAADELRFEYAAKLRDEIKDAAARARARRGGGLVGASAARIGPMADPPAREKERTPWRVEGHPDADKRATSRRSSARR